MTSWRGTTVTVSLWGEFTVVWWIPLSKGPLMRIFVAFHADGRLNKLLNKYLLIWDARTLMWRHCNVGYWLNVRLTNFLCEFNVWLQYSIRRVTIHTYTYDFGIVALMSITLVCRKYYFWCLITISHSVYFQWQSVPPSQLPKCSTANGPAPESTCPSVHPITWHIQTIASSGMADAGKFNLAGNIAISPAVSDTPCG